MPTLTREQLYAQLWSEPALKVAAQHGVSSSYLARVCEVLNIPRPPRGYWARIEHGQKPKRPPLPQPRPGDPTEWEPGRALPLRAQPALRVGAEPASGRHGLLVGAGEAFSVGWLSDSGYLRPRKQNIVDIFTSKATLPRALECANELFLLLQRNGYPVRLGDRGVRPTVDHREKGGRELQPWTRETWSPGRHTTVHVHDVPFGLTLYELSESVEVDLFNSKWVRVAEIPPGKRPKWRGWNDAPVFKDLPSGRLALRAYAPGLAWQEEWRERKAGELPSKFRIAVRELVAAVPKVKELRAEADRQAEIRRREREEQQRRWRKEEAERKRKEAYQGAREQLLKIIDEWAFARKAEEFFLEIEKRLEGVEPTERDQLIAQLDSARRMFGGTDARDRFRNWSSPIERLKHVETDEGTGIGSQLE